MSIILDNDSMNPASAQARELYGFTANEHADNDFIGFTYNNIHSSTLNIFRTSDGSRFNDNLLPTMSDKTVQITGGDGTYFFGSYYTQRQMSVSFAYDKMTEAQLHTLRTWSGDKGIHPLTFDELPYRTYYAKVSGTPTLKYICFTENGARVYKGEGTLVFTCFDAYAHVLNNKKYLANYSSIDYPTKSEWSGASRMVENYNSGLPTSWSINSIDTYNTPEAPAKPHINVYNPGDIDASWKLRLKFLMPTGATYYHIPALTMNLNNDTTDNCLIIDEIRRSTTNSNDSYVVFDSKTKLIEGYSANDQKTGSVYNGYIRSGDFFQLPTYNTQPDKFYIYKTSDQSSVVNWFKDATHPLQYDYLLL